MSKKITTKSRGEKAFFLSFFPAIFVYRVFGRFSAWGAQKHHTHIFKNGPENLKNLPKKVGAVSW
jgi:hypothetical protein